MRQLPLRVLFVGLALVLALPAAGWAAQNWRSESNPLKVYDDGVAKGEGYGTFDATPISGGAKVSDTGYLLDLHPTGNSIYIQTNYAFYTSSSGAGGTGADQFTSRRWNGDHWYKVSNSVSVGLPSSYDYSRGNIRVCEDQSLSPDPCSSSYLTGYDHF